MASGRHVVGGPPAAFRPPELKAEQQLRDRTTMFRRLGVVLSAIGVCLVVLVVSVVLLGGFVLTALSAGGADRVESAVVANVLLDLMNVGTATLTLLFATCFLMLGEQLRRGGIGANARPKSTVLPQGSYVSRFRPLSIRWHALWAIASMALALALLFLPAVGVVFAVWPATVGSDFSFAGAWQLDGIVALALAVAVVVSLFKKVHYHSVMARPAFQQRDGVRGAAAWRWLTYRWRLDLWVAGFGGILVGLSTIGITSSSWQTDDPDRVGNLLGGLVILAPGAVFIALGVWMASNYWRAGEPIGTAESYS